MPISDRVLIFSLVVFGLTNIVVGSKLFSPVRDRLQQINPRLGELAKCMMCAGFWVGLFVSILGLNLCNQLRHSTSSWAWKILDCGLDGFLASGVAWILFVVLARLGSEEL